jgi:GNAT superfamily N-acetyltransferase
MTVLQCICGERLEGKDVGVLHPVFAAHVASAHADWEAKDEDIDATMRIAATRPSWDGGVRTLQRPLDIRPVTPDATDEFVRFFEGEGFMDNPMWATCYCMFPNFTGSNEEWSNRSGQGNLADKIALFQAGEAHGLLAFGDEGQPVAWCAAGPKAEMGNLPRILKGEHTEAQGIGSIFCFVVAAPYRRQGVASRLLEAACEYLRGFDLEWAEAYPAAEAGSDAHAYHGPLEMYLEAGFQRAGEAGSRVVVRRALTPRAQS